MSNLENTLQQLSAVQKESAWIRSDLSVKSSSWFGRFFWRVCKHFKFAKKKFYGINLDASQKALRNIKSTITQDKNSSLVAIFNNAVSNFNKIAPNHSVEQIIEEKPTEKISIEKTIEIINAEHVSFKDLLAAISKDTCDKEIFVEEIPVPGTRHGKKKYSIATEAQSKDDTTKHTTTLANIISTNELNLPLKEIHSLIRKLIDVEADFSKEFASSEDGKKLLKKYYDAISKIYPNNLKNWFFLFLLLTFHFGVSFATDQPLLSSKAIRVAMQAKKHISESSVESIKEAVSSLEGLLHDSSFLRLDPQFQVDILFILSKGYERLERFTDQEKLLLSYARKRELYRYHVLLKTTLIRSYIRQERISESENLLSKFTKPSLAFLSLEEKIEIAKTIFFIEDHLYSLLKTADMQIKTFSLKEALKNYKTVLASSERFGFPFQASSVEKKHLRHMLLLRIAEIHYLQKNYKQTLLSLSYWKEESSEKDLLTKRHQSLLELAQNQQGLVCPLPFHQQIDPSTSPEILVWMAQEAIQQKDISSLEKIIDTLRLFNKVEFSSLLHILQGFKETLSCNIIVAYNELEKGLSSTNIWTNPWKESAMNLISELGWQRALLLTLSLQEKKAHDLCSQTIQNTSTATSHETILRTASFHLLDYFLEKKQSSLDSCASLLQTISSTQETSNNLYIALTSYLKENIYPNNLKNRNFSDLDIGADFSESKMDASVKEKTDSSGCLGILPDISSLSLEDQTLFFLCSQKTNSPLKQTLLPKISKDSPIASYFDALSSYTQAINGSIPEEQALFSLKEARKKAPDAVPQFYCYLIDLFLRTNQIKDACEITFILLQEYPNYTLTEQTLLTCTLALQSRPDFLKESLLFSQTLSKHPFSLQSFLLTINIFESNSSDYLNIELNPDQKKLLLSLRRRSEARISLSQANKSKEPGVIKSKIEETLFAFTEAENSAKELLNSLSSNSSTATPALSGYILSLESEHIDLLENCIIAPFAFNELPAYLTSLSATFLQDINTYSSGCLGIYPNNLKNREFSEEEYHRFDSEKSSPLLDIEADFSKSKMGYSAKEKTDSSGCLGISPSFLQECTYLGESAKIYTAAFTRDFDTINSFVFSPDLQTPQFFSSYGVSRGILFAAKALKESKKTEEAYALLSRLDEMVIKDLHFELALDIVLEKSLCLKDMKQIKKAMTKLAWVINSPCASSLRVKAMIVRADIYVSINRLDLAIKQLQSVVNKGGEWGVVAERKLRDLTTKT